MKVPSIPVAAPGWIMAQHRDEVLAAIERVLDSGWYILGAEVEAFEREFAATVGVEHGIGVASGTDAVAVALLACGVGPGDVVFTVSHTAVATAAAVVSTGAVPMLIDVDPASYTMSVPSLRSALAAVRRHHPELRPAAVVLVHLYGCPGPVDNVLEVCREERLRLVEDAAQAHGAIFEGRPVGSLGDAAAFSFYPTKNLGGLGDGGMVLTADDGIAEEARLQRQYGWRVRYISERVGRNSRLDEVQAAVLRTLLPRLDSWNEHRRALAARYNEGLAGVDVRCPAPPPGRSAHVYHQYVIQLDDRDELAARLEKAGIGSAVLYPEAIHEQEPYRTAALAVEDLGATERLCRRILSLPIGPHVSTADVDRVLDAVASFVPSGR